ncbi:MAG: hypothetical protein JSR47_07400 [Proteobacteria bacterium]|nr:hypothetical protein [Pseudomonadota bacterium]MBS0550822.1 hypothetical protein [Pseudomonadota bacterium]
MAKRTPETSPAADKAKVRVFFAEVEGNNDSVQEALKTMVSAMSRPVRVISDNKSQLKGGALTHAADTEDASEPAGEFDEIAEVEAVEEESDASNVRRPRGTGKKTDRNAGIVLVPDLNFRPAGQQSLKEFVEAKSPKSDVETVLVAFYYMQQIMRLANLGPNHVMTAFKEVGKAIPVDLKQTIRNIRKSKMWLNFTDIEDVRTTTQGSNYVEHEMGKGD